MNAGKFKIKIIKPCSGFALLMLVISMAIMLVIFLIYFETLMPFISSSGNKPVNSDPNAYPWDEQHLLMTEGYGWRKPFRPQPSIEDKILYNAQVYDENEPCGQVSLAVYKDGQARARWNGKFKIGDRNYLADTELKSGSSTYFNRFSGNTVPLKLYKKNQKTDGSKLYVITKGDFFLRSLQDTQSLIGSAYVTAWIDDDYTAEGKLSIPSLIYGRIAEFKWGPVSPTESTPDTESPSQE
ncbi:MAG: hypothetical protein MUO22_05130 [Sedimentisphaerales bacterium]|nr:hypothetical protein [Sedimentisphaerales bacterium]